MRFVWIFSALVAFFLSTAAHAQSSAAVDQLKVHADQAMDNLRYGDALDGYEKAYALSRDPRFLYNMGRALGAMGRYPEAVVQLERFRVDAPAALRDRVPQLDQIIGDFKKHVATLAISSNVPGARVLVRDRAIGTTPLGDLQVDAGPALVEVDADDYVAQRQNVVLPGGGRVELVFQLVKASPLGVLVVRSTPPASTVLVDGASKGGTPLEAPLMPGRHALLLSREGFRDLSASAIVERGVRRELDFNLEKKPSLVSRPWFWTVVGVAVLAVAAGVVTAVVCAQTTACERAPDDGSILGGPVRGP
ncbi:MAG TPA: PEGA domain-containing protein [Polyangiaceae bacterium]|jgi:hypothetical protein